MAPVRLGSVVARWRARARRLARLGAIVSIVGTASTGLVLLGAPTAAAAVTGGGGANLPYTELQAESASTNGTVIGPSYTQGQLADEASGRKAVTLASTGQYVEFT